MLSRALLVAVLICAFNIGYAQSDSTKLRSPRIQYFNSLAFCGLVNDDFSGNPSLRMSHGVRLNRLSIAASVGYDAFEDVTTIPFTGQITFDYLRLKSTSFYVSLDAGISKIKLKDQKDYLHYEISDGTVINPMTGVRFVRNKMSLYFALGYNAQKFDYTDYSKADSSVNPPLSRTEMEFNRMSILFGIGFQ